METLISPCRRANDPEPFSKSAPSKIFQTPSPHLMPAHGAFQCTHTPLRAGPSPGTTKKKVEETWAEHPEPATCETGCPAVLIPANHTSAAAEFTASSLAASLGGEALIDSVNNAELQQREPAGHREPCRGARRLLLGSPERQGINRNEKKKPQLCVRLRLSSLPSWGFLSSSEG